MSKFIGGCPPSLEAYKSDPVLMLHHIWLLSVVVAAADVITSFVVASANDSISNGSKGAGFAAIWSMFMVISVSVFAHFALKKWQTQFSIGYLIGALCMMSQMFLTLFCVFVGLAKSAEYAEKDDDSALDSDNGTMAFFSFTLLIVYGIFGVMVFRNRSSVVKIPATTLSDGPPDVGNEEFDPTEIPPAGNQA
eukprot:FR734617.1.p1 GENE.FR734617.1~~FR734617.1.p1  ORF type:complete len:193 (+),score=16.60 FR734617.1:58-636(+)